MTATVADAQAILDGATIQRWQPVAIDLAHAVVELQVRVDRLERDNYELRRRTRVVFEALDIDRSTVIAKRAVRSMLKGR